MLGRRSSTTAWRAGAVGTALAALGLGGSAIAGATSNDSTKAPAAAEQDGAAEQPATEANEASERAGGEASEQRGGDGRNTEVGAVDAKRAGDAALAAVGTGKVTEVNAESPDPADGADKPQKGETPDPAYESKIAYDVEVTKADGSVVDVHLDKAFGVLGTEKGDQHMGDHHDEAGEQSEAPAAGAAR